MTKTELLSRLKRVRQNECQTRGLFTMVQVFINYFADPNIPEYEYTGIFHSLPKHIVRAVDILRTSDDPKIEALRKSYADEMERGDREIPSLTDIAFGGLNRAMVCHTLSHDLPKILLDEKESVWLEKNLYAYFTAQDTVVQQMIHRFDLTVYQQGLCVIIDDCKSCGMAGTFGTTSLRSYTIAGRVMFTLARQLEGETVIRNEKGVEVQRLPYQERSISFVGEDGKKSEPRFGIQSMYADLMTTMSMFEDVIGNWPKDKKEQKNVYKADRDIGMM